MALFIRDPEVDALAEEVRRLMQVKTKTEAVRRVLQLRIAQERLALPFQDRLARSQQLADAMGPRDPAFDMKAFTDEMWND